MNITRANIPNIINIIAAIVFSGEKQSIKNTSRTIVRHFIRYL